jgi:hypothetical protein
MSDYRMHIGLKRSEIGSSRGPLWPAWLIVLAVIVAMFIAVTCQSCSKHKNVEGSQPLLEEQASPEPPPAPEPELVSTGTIQVEFINGSSQQYDSDCTNKDTSTELIIYVRGCGGLNPDEGILAHIPIHSIKTWRAVK